MYVSELGELLTSMRGTIWYIPSTSKLVPGAKKKRKSDYVGMYVCMCPRGVDQLSPLARIYTGLLGKPLRFHVQSYSTQL